MQLLTILIVFFLHESEVFCDQLFTFRGKSSSSNLWPGSWPRHQMRPLVCISDNPYDPLIWNTNLVWKQKDTVYLDRDNITKPKLSSPIPDTYGINCDFNSELNPCFSKWSQLDGQWKVVESLDVPMGPIFDSRWDDLQEHTTFNSERKNFKLIKTLRDTGTVVLSIRGDGNAHFLLCTSPVYFENFCYWIILGGWYDRPDPHSGVRKCTAGVRDGKYPGKDPSCEVLHQRINHRPLSKEEWKTFIITWQEENSTINIYDPDGLVLSYSDDQPPIAKNDSQQEYYFFFDNPNDGVPKIYRLHNYTYTMVQQPQAELSAQLQPTDSDDICIDMLIGLCANCDMEVSIVDGNNQSLISPLFRGNSVSQKAGHDLPQWQHAKIKLQNVTTHSSPFTIRIITKLSDKSNSLNLHWAIANVRECLPEGTVKKTSVTAFQDSDGRYYWPNVTCQKLSYNDEDRMLLDPDRKIRAFFEPTSFTDDSQLCQESYFGPYCATRCNEYFESDCRNMILCDEQECYCPPGITGDNCDSRCGVGSYGYGCRKACGTCSGKEGTKDVCDVFTGKCSQCQNFPDKYLIPPYCKYGQAIVPPLSPFITNVTSQSAHVSNVIQRYENVEMSFGFHLRKKSSSDYQYFDAEEIPNFNFNSTNKAIKLNALFNNLEAGTQYWVRMSISIKNGGYNLEGAWGNFTTSCRNFNQYIVVPDESSLKVTKVPNEETAGSCPDSWYKIKLYSVPQRRLENSSGRFPVNFTNLKPYRDYEVEITGLDGSVSLKKQVKTLEAAPSEVRKLRIDDLGSTTATITWSAPVSPNGRLRGYTIRIKPEYYVGCYGKQSSGLNLEERSIELDASAKSAVIKELRPYFGYRISVSAHNSKPGIENTISFETNELETPIEKWVDLTFAPGNSRLSWKDPDCTAWTGVVNGSRLFFTGISLDVKDFRDSHTTQWHSFRLNNTKPQNIHGRETYNVKVHLLHAHRADKYNSAIFTELNFTTPPSAPPKVRNFKIVEVDSENQLITLRWQKPYPPTNGRIITYKIEVPSARGKFKSFEVSADEPCSLWDDWFCKTVNRTYTSSGYIKVSARNDGVEKTGETSEISNHIVEEDLFPGKPRDVNFSVFENGVVYLKWRHPWKTGVPIKKFRIKGKVLRTDLARPLRAPEDKPFKEVSIATYKKDYDIHMYLLPSTMYELTIQGVGKRLEGKMETVKVTTESASDFGPMREPIINDQESQINIIIPAIVNDTRENVIHIILIGPRPCSSSWPIPKMAEEDLDLKSGTSAWHIAKFRTLDVADTAFTIGNDKVHGGMANCPLPNGTYQIAYVVHNDSRKASDRFVKVLHWRSKKLQIGPVTKIPHEAWLVPLVLLLIAGAGIAWFYSRRRAGVKRRERSDDIYPPILTPRNQSLCKETSLLVASRESIAGVCDAVQTPDVVPESERTHSNNASPTLIKLKEFQDYVKNGIASGKLNAQYEAFPRGQTKPWEYGQLPENKSKNRYANLIAYDETRVKLEKLLDDPYSDYINANYIKGYQKNKAYIATQGPRQNTLNDFWRMIWQERVQVICMLANVLESGKTKCEQYWPEIGKELTFGNITVHNLSHTTFADYTFRTFSVTCDQETRRMEHLHYTAWPDHGVPQYIQSVVTYLKKLLATPLGHGPIVVHCSAGIGRTGTIILCDICLRKAAAQGVIDVFAETTEIRNQRANMVDNEQQYLLAHLALVECLLSLPTAIPCNDTLPMRIQEYKKQLPLQQQRLDESTWQDKALRSPMHKPMELSQKNIAKNRYPELAALVGPTLHISRYPTTDDDSDYIFGSYVDSAMRKNNYIASQLPLPSTVNDFWRMIAEFNVELVIVLQPPDEKDPTCCEFVLQFDEELNPTPFLNFKGRESIDEDICTSRKILLTDSSAKPPKERAITFLCLKEWEPGEYKSPPKPITLVNFWQYAERIPRGDGPTVVLCHDGVRNCGLYLALSFLLERMGLERECDVCLAIRAIRRSRPDFCKTLDQFEYLYDTALVYADYFETYANFM
ncbi:receptor-type tyrosine-protein phosphatase F [Diachasma alloeum]|uniref:receptor-type tyrosine-protein phosphatase F n=1 Tax=Diachasma alloeum TaxID=454923 RepID=UPI00073844BF|nr:receptor-type tyrosine-protein phosphatase F [Diachasma alloeum]